MPQIGTHARDIPAEGGGLVLYTFRLMYSSKVAKRHPGDYGPEGFYADLPEHMAVLLDQGRRGATREPGEAWVGTFTPEPITAASEGKLRHKLNVLCQEAVALSERADLVIGVRVRDGEDAFSQVPIFGFKHIVAFRVAFGGGGQPVFFWAHNRHVGPFPEPHPEPLHPDNYTRGTRYGRSEVAEYQWVDYTPERLAAIMAAGDAFARLRAQVAEVFGTSENATLALDGKLGTLLLPAAKLDEAEG
jgi:hypothetical protein